MLEEKKTRKSRHLLIVPQSSFFVLVMLPFMLSAWLTSLCTRRYSRYPSRLDGPPIPQHLSPRHPTRFPRIQITTPGTMTETMVRRGQEKAEQTCARLTKEPFFILVSEFRNFSQAWEITLTHEVARERLVVPCILCASIAKRISPQGLVEGRWCWFFKGYQCFVDVYIYDMI